MPAPITRHLRVLGLGLLCLCVFMQVLGAPTSLWSIVLEEDLVEGSMLEDVSIPTRQIVDAVTCFGPCRSRSPHVASEMLLERDFFRPPCDLA